MSISSSVPPASRPRGRGERPGGRAPLAALAAWALVFFAASVANGQEHQDTLVVYDGEGRSSHTNLTVENEGLTEVTYRTRGGSRVSTRPSAEVADVTYGDAPDVWNEALAAMSRRRWEVAIDAFDAAVSAHESAGRVRAWVVPAARFHQARCRLALAQRDKSQADAAVDAWRDWLATHGEHRLAPEAHDYAGQAMILAGEGRAALDTYQELKALATANDLHPLHTLKADLGAAMAYDALENWASAIPAYGAVLQTAKSQVSLAKLPALRQQMQEVVYDAAAQRGEAMLAKAESGGDTAEAFRQAQRYFSGLRAQMPGDARIAAIADIGMAICKRDTDPREALRDLAEAKVKHFAASDEMAKALFYMAGAARQLDQERQAAAFEAELKEMYPDSIWARKTK